jgi:hypothetical protein
MSSPSIINVHQNESISGDSGFIREVWFGQRSLGETYWLWGWLVSAILVGAIGRVIFFTIATATGTKFPIYLYFALLLPVDVWHLVGQWRSATNHPSGWATLVKVSYVLAVPVMIITWLVILVNPSWIQQ